ncbi:GNAT family N-acetyltransferase [Anaerosporobacter faecicola]|uniref:GNAT family N-acetyltransferase n=1 Tax=Anaerosporobacter faecicola TaxID=2718714 RepID=UPI0014388C91|nr:GNAT family N-acetyltransferase [Anaerosporobacter faecicola]
MNFKELETERLNLKNISTEDSAFILSEFSDDDINEYLFDEEPMTDLQEAMGLIEFYTVPEPREQHRWILVRKSDGQKIGTCGFHCWNRDKHVIEMGYDMKKAYWGNGYMQEAIKAILALAKDELEVHEVILHIYPENKKSVALATKFGFVKSDETIDYDFRGKTYVHSIYTRIL